MSVRRAVYLAIAQMLVLVPFTTGCADNSPAAPSVPHRPPPLVTVSVAGIEPSTGSTGGDTRVTIMGTGFEPGGIVTVAGIPIVVNWYGFGSCAPCSNSTTLFGTTRAGAAGTGDVVVTSPDGQAGRLPGAYTYAPPDSFDVNGRWQGYTGDHEYFGFEIQNGAVVSVSCGREGDTLTMSPPLHLSQGAFSFSADGGIAVSGKIVSSSQAIGVVAMAPCRDDWSAIRR